MATVPFYVLLGESNSAWTPATQMTAQEKSNYSGVIPMTEIWNPARGGYSAKIEPLEIGVNTMCENFADPTHFGLEVSFFKALQASNPKQRFLYKQGQANTSLVADWKPVFPFTGGEGGRWAQLNDWFPLALSQASAKGYQLDLKAVFWIGGENDSKPPAEARAKVYLTALNNLFGEFDKLWKGLAAKYGFPTNNYKRVVGRVYAPGASFPYRDMVRAAQTEFCANPANNAVLIDTDSYPLYDYAHYNSTGMLQYGLDVFNLAKCESAGVQTSNNVAFSGKVFLQAAFNSAAGNMTNHLNTRGILQSLATAQPYSSAPFNYNGSETVPANFFAGHPEIVDWVLLELRDANNPANAVAKRAAFVKEDGTIVDINGSSTQVNFSSLTPGSFFVVVRHRNHLGIRSSTAVDFSNGSASYDFTTESSKAFQNQSYTSTAQVGNVWTMRAGNANSNNNVKYSGPGNDQGRIVNDMLGGSLSTVLDNVYASEDVNMDGIIKANGPGNDQDFLLNTVLAGSTSTVYNEQI